MARGIRFRWGGGNKIKIKSLLFVGLAVNRAQCKLPMYDVIRLENSQKGMGASFLRRRTDLLSTRTIIDVIKAI